MGQIFKYLPQCFSTKSRLCPKKTCSSFVAKVIFFENFQVRAWCLLLLFLLPKQQPQWMAGCKCHSSAATFVFLQFRREYPFLNVITPFMVYIVYCSNLSYGMHLASLLFFVPLSFLLASYFFRNSKDISLLPTR
ncbi:hypothetical protein V8C42DRAFT_52646 [Trichoderma barbatum]